MVSGVGKAGAAGAATEKLNVVNTPISTGGSAGPNGQLSHEVDSKEAATQSKFGDVMRQIQAKYGEKPEKPREIKKTLGKDDFLRIMITQMKNQDPTSPFKAEQMAAEIAQFTSVEQLQNVNQNLTKMANQNKPLEQMAMTNLIGKVVTIDRERFPHSEGQNEPLSFNLPKDAGSVTVKILSELGEEVHQKDLGPQKKGEVSFVWDGTKTNTLPAKAGNYIYRITAMDGRGQVIDINPQTTGHVIGVSFENTEPVFLVGDARHQDKITLKNIVRIEVDQAQKPVASTQKPDPVGQQLPPGLSQQLPPELLHQLSPGQAKESPSEVPRPSNFIPFQKGVGSGEFGGQTIPMPPPLPQASEIHQAPSTSLGSQGGAALPPPPIVEEKGFPNGLQDPEQQKGGETS